MRKTIKIILFIFMIMFCINIGQVYAASATVSASKTSATVGDSVTITVNINAASWNVAVKGSGISDSIVGYNEDAVNQSKSKQYTLSTAKAGTYTVTISGDVTDQNDSKVSVNKSVTVTVTEPAPAPTPTPTPTPKPSNNTSSNKTTTQTKSSNSKLSSLRVAEGAISPEFSSDIYEYSISVSNGIEKLSIEAITDNSKATFSIVGNDTLQVGQNTIEVIVTAENGKKSTYKIYATRADKDLALTALSVYYINDDGQNTAIPIEPTFSFDTYNYKTEKISYKIKDIKIEAIANKENAKIEILGNEELKNGINTITIKVTYAKEDGQEEQKTYSLTVEKEEEPVIATLSTTEQIKNWFIGAGNAIGNWTSTNFNKILSGLLLISSIALAGLTVYFVYDYKKYQQLIGKLAEYNKGNLMERANVALNPEVTIFNESNSEEDNSQLEPQENAESINIEPIVEEKQEKVKSGKGKRFKI